MKSVEDAISDAERILPGVPAPEGQEDPRWQAVIRVAAFVETDPEPLWTFARDWGSSDDPDLRAAIATCLLEHLLEHHFDRIFPRLERAARDNAAFADTFLGCWQFGQAKEPDRATRFERLKEELAKRAS